MADEHATNRPVHCPVCHAPRYQDEDTCRYCAHSLLSSSEGRARLGEGLLLATTGLILLCLTLASVASATQALGPAAGH